MGLTIAEGWMLEGKAEAITTVLEARFDDIPVDLKKKINRVRSTKRMEKALKLAATCKSLKEFQKGM